MEYVQSISFFIMLNRSHWKSKKVTQSFDIIEVEHYDSQYTHNSSTIEIGSLVS